MENGEKGERKIEISAPTPDDARDIQEVFYKTWLSTYPNEEAGITKEDIEEKYKDAFTEETLMKRRERITNSPKNQFALVARDNGKVIGFCRVIREEDKNKLSTIYILPEYQGKGIGQALWNQIKTYLDIHKNTVLGVATYNTNAISFYKKLGFEDTGKRYFDDTVMASGHAIPEMEMLRKAEAAE